MFNQSEQSWLCGVCNQVQAPCFCQCQGRDSFLCETCFPVHYAKNPRLVHIAIPIAAYGQHRIPGYLDRFQARSMNVSIGKTELLKNIEEVDKCIAEVSGEIQQVLNAVWEYGNSIVAELQQVKAELERDIYAAIAEVESTIHEDAPTFATSLATEMCKSSENADTFKLFTYRIDASSILPAIQSICVHSIKKSAFSHPFLAGIHQNVLNLYDLSTGGVKTVSLSVQFTNPRTCFISDTELICVGGQPSVHTAYLLSCSPYNLTELQPMLVPRCSPGMITVAKFVYVFGGHPWEQSCEKFSLTDTCWYPLPMMDDIRFSFSPCVLRDDIYLPTDRPTIEIMNIHTELFRTVKVQLNGLKKSSISAVIDDEIVMVTCANQVGRWKVGSEGFAVGAVTNMGEFSNSQTTPVVVGRKVYYVYWETGRLNCFDLDTNIISTIGN